MDYSYGISGGTSLHDIFRYQRQQALQSSRATGPASPGATASEGAVGSGGASPVVPGIGRPRLDSALASLLIKLQGDSAQSQVATDGDTDAADATSSSNGSIRQSDLEQAFAAAADTLFSKLDQDGDGTLNNSEIQTAVDSLESPHRRFGPGHRGENAPAPDGSLEQLLKSEARGRNSEPLSKIQIETALAGTLDTSQADQLFGSLDLNGDGSIDSSEARRALHHRHRDQAGLETLSAAADTGSTADQTGGAEAAQAA